MFVGRENELKIISSAIQKPGSLLVYGLRRIGKTTLIKKALDDNHSKYIYFECQKANEQIKEIKGLNITEIGFVSSSSFNSSIEGIKYLDIDDIFFEN